MPILSGDVRVGHKKSSNEYSHHWIHLETLPPLSINTYTHISVHTLNVNKHMATVTSKALTYYVVLPHVNIMYSVWECNRNKWDRGAFAWLGFILIPSLSIALCFVLFWCSPIWAFLVYFRKIGIREKFKIGNEALILWICVCMCFHINCTAKVGQYIRISINMTITSEYKLIWQSEYKYLYVFVRKWKEI